ncbi:MAG: hypothetical protein GY850_35365 [bacterium]|nr:hypothetical protein [bacterium]
MVFDLKRCIGCNEHCPYQVRSLVRDSRTVYADGKTVFEKPVHQKILNNVATKCAFCYHRVETGMQPSCCEVCPTGARVFGDLSDEASTVSLLIKKHNGWQMPPDKGTQPFVYYIG